MGDRRRHLRALLLAAAKQRASAALALDGDALFAPYSPSPDSVIHAVWTHFRTYGVSLAPHELLVDLGCGDGRWLVSGVREFGCQALGIELDPALVRAAIANVSLAGFDASVRVIEGDIMQVPIHEARLVIVYAFAESLHGIREHLVSQLGANAIVLSIGFRVPDWKPKWSEKVGGLRWYLYAMQSCSPSASETDLDSTTTEGAARDAV